MDKSESELLEEWDLVSSVYDNEQENGTAEKKTDTESNSAKDVSANIEVENRIEPSLKSSETEDKETADDLSEESDSLDTEQTVEAVIVSGETQVSTETNEATEAGITPEQISSIENVIEEPIEVDEPVDVMEETKVGDITEQISAVSAVSPETTGTDEKLHTEKNLEISSEDTDEMKSNNTAVHTLEITDEKESDSNIEGSAVETEKNSYAGNEENKAEAIPDDKTDTSVAYNNLNNSDDNIVNSSLDSSMEHIQIEHCEGSSVEDVPELISNLVEQENAAIESSSSDIDIIDENVEESVTSSFIHPLSLSITSSVDSSNILTSSSEEDKKLMTDQKLEDTKVFEKTETQKPPSYSESSESYIRKSESFPSSSESYFQESRYRDEYVPPEPQRPHPRNAAGGLFAGILEFIRNMTRFEWSILGGVMLCLYVTIVFNETNIFAVVEKEDVVSQLKNMIDDLKHDNKILKDQMLSEMKNDKVFSTFEHQIKELKKENSKLNHMLYDVAKVLEEQKDTQRRFEKREADYIAPFKTEINKLKEHINILKFDNEELQKQLVRMRYASYSQGGRDTDSDKTTEQKDDIKSDEADSTEEIALDINALKKWNELISLLSKELGLSENEPLTGGKSQSDTRNISWYWKTFLHEFKGTFKDLKSNVTSVISDYKKANEKAVSEIYKFVKDFFTVKEEEKQKFTPPGEESSQWKNIGDFVKDLSEKWTNIKDRIYTSDIKNFVLNYKKSEETGTSQGSHNAEKAKNTAYDYNERKPTNVYSDRKYDKPESNSEDSKWMFKRAELRAELRDSEKEDPSDNWYLKRKKRTSQYDTDENEF